MNMWDNFVHEVLEEKWADALDTLELLECSLDTHCTAPPIGYPGRLFLVGCQCALMEFAKDSTQFPTHLVAYCRQYYL